MFVWTTDGETHCAGFDETGALFGGAFALVFGGLLAVLLSLPSLWGLGVLGIVVTLCVGCRYSIRIGPDGIRLTLYRFWLVPVHRRHSLLDANIDLHHDLDVAELRGLVIRELYADPGFDNESDVFGPRFGQTRLVRLHARLVNALEAMRAAAANAPVPPELRNFKLGPQMGAFDLVRAIRDDRGRLRRVRSVSPVYLGEVEVPPGSMFHFNEDRFLDPRREDRLHEVVLGGPIPLLGKTVRPGASFVFAPSGRLSSLRGAFESEVEIDGTWVNGRDVLSFNEEGELMGFTLAKDGRAAGRRFPIGSRFQCWPGDDLLPTRWTVRLGGPLELPDITLRAGESIELSDDTSRITGIWPRHDVKAHGLVVRAGIVPIPLRKDGRIDLAGCLKSGILRPREGAEAQRGY
ncbi:hypothetical protein [Polyangium mundeleinium]|uniref:Uncharacterized protein n=1 Tax=Polyangium mundeleinium TaxID=2995306 RepID=A0ABT5F4Z9_9BACT|nr:hypothetical protein [Polyangium mundeleinium]MDC0749162.1 hypothetical protein [Polyangium mundeleinium]